jgi:hypothetical protein
VSDEPYGSKSYERFITRPAINGVRRSQDSTPDSKSQLRESDVSTNVMNPTIYVASDS